MAQGLTRTDLTASDVRIPAWMTALAVRPGAAHTDDDEFDDDSIDSAWTTVTAAGTATWTEKRGLIIADAINTGTVDMTAQIKSMTPSSSPVTIETRVQMFNYASSQPGAHIGFSDGNTATSNIASLYYYNNGASMYNYDVSGTFTGLTYNGYRVVFGAPILGWTYLRAVWTATNTFEWAFSTDGIVWTDLGVTSFSRTITPTHFFIGAINDGAGHHPVTFEYFRVTESDLSV